MPRVNFALFLCSHHRTACQLGCVSHGGCATPTFRSPPHSAPHLLADIPGTPNLPSYSLCTITPCSALLLLLSQILTTSGLQAARSADPPRRSRSTSAGIQCCDIGAACSNLGYFAASPSLREYQPLDEETFVPASGAPDLPESRRRCAADGSTFAPSSYPWLQLTANPLPAKPGRCRPRRDVRVSLPSTCCPDVADHGAPCRLRLSLRLVVYGRNRLAG